ncbi:hypothetical protein AWC38_SpisGene9993 [Stylophora pistillata]|uniref:Uncharacterized protein n=1 Tax=Stylophora pistillata TaxID=50429 RepID=A0A2B4S654_STYPI|nr:hypothetical protein AWC38_SpisGene9993 [Stylophora pistillata]
MDSQKHYQVQQRDTGIRLTPEGFRFQPSNFGQMQNTTPAEFLIKPSFGVTPNTTPEENVASAGIGKVSDALRLFNERIELSMDPTENQHATQKQAFLLGTWKSVHAAALNEIKKSQVDNGSVCSKESRHLRRSSVSSRSSCRDTIINIRAKRVALEDKLKFSAAIAEQEKKLEQLKLQEKLGEAQAQEAVHEKALEEDDKEDDSPSPMLPTRQYDPINAFLSDNAE